MELAMVGLGRMGGNMAERLLRGGHHVVGHARRRESLDRILRLGLGGDGVTSPQAVVEKLTPPRVIWLMIPAGAAVDEMLEALTRLLAQGDIVVDGGNSYYRDTLRRAELLRGHGLRFVDVGTSGGIWGLTEGYSMMIGGEAATVQTLRPIFQTLAPGPDRGWGHVGPHGAGHFVKMVHNGIEYGMMQALAEGFAIMKRKEEFGLDLHQVAEIWRHGSVVRSWLLDLTSRALADDQALAGVVPHVSDSGEGRWTVAEAIDLDVAAPVITLALQQRLRSRDDYAFADRLLAMMRYQFGGHEFQRKPS
jgi:6-phosphogluconate dehydrogenase